MQGVDHSIPQTKNKLKQILLCKTVRIFRKVLKMVIELGHVALHNLIIYHYKHFYTIDSFNSNYS
jgi:hypothetical protein